jgi:hypothetical protein
LKEFGSHGGKTKCSKNSKEIAMRRSRPGERRGGRKKGTPNKKTAYVRAVMACHSSLSKVIRLLHVNMENEDRACVLGTSSDWMHAAGTFEKNAV